ncbi:MAG: TonB-dependent receptor [Bacteroidales bacterium]|nr:TonB-dependent receptor [Bacteroidales bacterium]
MREKKITLLIMLILFGISLKSYSQSVTGTVYDKSTGEPLPGATVMIEGTTTGTVTLLNGSFSLKVEQGKSDLRITYVGFLDYLSDLDLKAGETKDLGKLELEPDAIGITEIFIVASFAKDRKTPVAISNIDPEMIIEKLGTQEFPEILKSTPSVYATKRGGGYGDGRFNLRGFDSNNIGVLINGVPVNDMENGKVYWSNWAGLSDVTRVMQIQRGLGASKLAISSIGGTLNIITNTTDVKQGGSVYYAIGNNGYNKTGLTLSTGLTDNGWAVTVSGSRTVGDGYILGTDFEGWSYFMNVSKRLSAKQQISLTAFGAPQWHNQRNSSHLVEKYLNHPEGFKFNTNYGYRNGKIYGGDHAYNKYHKPQISLNHTVNFNSKTFLSTAIYASLAKGGGRRASGNNADYLQFNYPNGTPKDSTKLTPEGYLDYDAVADINSNSLTGSEAVISMSTNSHDWYGFLSTLNKEIENLSITAGLDGRYYRGYHYTEIDDLLGGEYFLDNLNVNRDPGTTLYKGDKISYYNLTDVMWAGIFLQAEYSVNNFSAFISAAVSNTTYKRTDYFKYYDDYTKQEIEDIKSIKYSDADSSYIQLWDQLVADEINNLGVEELSETQERDLYLANKNSFDIDHIYQVSDKVNFLGYSVKGGVNYNINKEHNVFLNGGYFTRAPFANAVFLNYSNNINSDAKPQKVLSTELGYGYRTSLISGDLTLYRTSWMDKTITRSVGQETANITGLNAVHQGIEAELRIFPTKKLDIRLMFSTGDWRWESDVDAALFDENQEFVDSLYIYSKDIHVSDAAQTTGAIGINYEVLPKLKIGADYNYYNRLFGQFDIEGRTKPELSGIDAWELPDYHLFDVNIKYDFKIGKLKTSLYGKINNVLNTEYIADASDNTLYDGVVKYGNESNSPVFFGFGRTWSLALKIRF